MEIITALWQFDTYSLLKTRFWQNIIYGIIVTILPRVFRSPNNVRPILPSKIVAWAKEIHMIKETGLDSPRLGD